MEIREYRPTDHAEWLRMRRRLWPEIGRDVEADDAAEWLARSDTVVLVAVRPDGQGLAGFAELGTRAYVDGCDTSPVAYLEGWYVDPDARRTGVGTALVRAGEAWAERCGLRELASDAFLENDGSQRAHEAIGFTEVERAVRYRKALQSGDRGARPAQPENAAAAKPAGGVDIGGATPILRVGSLAASLAFYQTGLGFALRWRDGDFACVGRGDATLMLCEGCQGQPGTWVYVGAGDADLLAEELRGRGVALRHPPTNYPWGARELQVADPDGHVLRFGSDARPGEPLGDWLDEQGRRWTPQPDGTWRAAAGE